MKSKEIKEKTADSKYCNRVNKIFSLGYIDLGLSKTLVLDYLKATDEKKNLLDEESELAIQQYTNGISILNRISKSTERTSNIVLFFFWVTILGWIVTLILYLFF